MERLTKKNKHNRWVTPFCTRYDDEELNEQHTGRSVSKLADYEDRDEKGCDWCNRTDGYARTECTLVDHEGNNLVVDHMIVSSIADYCPKCGKKLTNK